MADITSEQERGVADNFEEILAELPFVRDASQAAREILLANLVMIGEIPSPTFEEFRRVEFIQNRFVESGLHNASADEMGNALGILPGSSGEHGLYFEADGAQLFWGMDPRFLISRHLGQGHLEYERGLVITWGRQSHRL